jgi:hypothetical protein
MTAEPTLIDLASECMSTVRPLITMLEEQDGDAAVLVKSLKHSYAGIVNVFESAFHAQGGAC